MGPTHASQAMCRRGPVGARMLPSATTLGGLVAVCMWGLAPVATRALVTQIAPLPLLLLRLALAAIVLAPWCGPVLGHLSRVPLTRLVAAGLLGMVGYNLPVTVALQWIPASTSGLVLASEPIWILALGRLFLGEAVPRRSWAAAVALCGIAIIAGPDAFAVRGGLRDLAGVALVLVGAVSFAAYTLILRPLARTYGALPATASSTVVGAVPYLAFAGTLSAHRLGRLPSAAWGELGFLALGSTAAGLLLWSLAGSHSDSSKSPSCSTSSLSSAWPEPSSSSASPSQREWPSVARSFSSGSQSPGQPATKLHQAAPKKPQAFIHRHRPSSPSR